ncbi:DUF418 domain-containing protein [Bacillus sp. HMF5848]|uniref:DUF418 domain-containing protein n=1 Tax=Bacillus sp. HMF5848 TaxID=2495421 RepID=UPI000F779708|nr:DUF418 domain-containing protein [Bacillus sp. HMF5848]RSK28845.1 DUF418 domain-containing protein [Bacillus sp. HMF5848]
MDKQLRYGPTSQSERIVTLDVIRAIALLGILSVNMKFFSTPTLQAEMAGVSYANSILDHISQWFLFIVADFKFISMFSMLFGIGFLLFMERGKQSGIDVRRLFKRRLLILLCFGLIHIFFFWYGDILTFYALLGFALLLTHEKKPSYLLKASFITISIPIILFLSLALLLSSFEQGSSPAQQTTNQNELNRIIEVYSEGSLGDIFTQRLNDISVIMVGNVFLFALVLTMFFFGMYLWKTKIFTHTSEQLARIRKMAVTALLLAIPGLILAVAGEMYVDGGDSPWYFLQYAGLFMSGPTLSVFYVMSLLLLLQNEQRLTAAVKFLQPTGKMALTNYLMQTLLCTIIFYSFGFGLFGKVGPFYGLLITIFIYALQILYSYYWMKKFQYGPMEWLWRRLMYGKLEWKTTIQRESVATKQVSK